MHNPASMRWGSALLSVGLVTFISLAARAEDANVADALFREGQELLREGKIELACTKLAESHKIDRRRRLRHGRPEDLQRDALREELVPGGEHHPHPPFAELFFDTVPPRNDCPLRQHGPPKSVVRVGGSLGTKTGQSGGHLRGQRRAGSTERNHISRVLSLTQRLAHAVLRA